MNNEVKKIVLNYIEERENFSLIKETDNELIIDFLDDQGYSDELWIKISNNLVVLENEMRSFDVSKEKFFCQFIYQNKIFLTEKDFDSIKNELKKSIDQWYDFISSVYSFDYYWENMSPFSLLEILSTKDNLKDSKDLIEEKGWYFFKKEWEKYLVVKIKEDLNMRYEYQKKEDNWTINWTKYFPRELDSGELSEIVLEKLSENLKFLEEVKDEVRSLKEDIELIKLKLNID